LFHTGHDENWAKGYKAYIGDGYSHLTSEAALYLADKGVRYVAFESISPDPDNVVDAHKILLGKGIPIVENICNLGQIESTRVTTIGTFPAVKGGTGVWVRILAVY
jgi:kynurenine formamidase